MNTDNENIEDLILRYIDGELSDKDGKDLEDRIKSDPQIRDLYDDYLEMDKLMRTDPGEEPDDHLRLVLGNNLNETYENDSTQNFSLSGSVWLKIAASITLVAIGGIITLLTMDYWKRDNDITAIKQDPQQKRALLMTVAENDLSAGKRLERVQASYSMEEPDADILGVLINVMNKDDNVNVRIAAIKALASYTEKPVVRKALVNTLENQKDPFIQIMLINILVKIMEKDAIPQFRKMMEKESVEPSVKDEAQMGLYKLS